MRFYWLVPQYGVNNYCVLCTVKAQKGNKNLQQRTFVGFHKHSPLLTMPEVKDVRAHCCCASLVRTLYMTWCVPRHVFQARAPSRNSTKYRADDLCGNLIFEYFCWMLADPHFFFGRPLPFLILFVILKDKKNLYVGSFNYFSYTIQIGSNWYMDTAVRDLEVACFKANSTWINDIGSRDLSNRPIYAVLNTHNLDMILQLLNVCR